MKTTQWGVAASLITVGAGLALPAQAEPIITQVLHYTDRYAPNSAPGFASASIGNHVQWDVLLNSVDPPGTSVVVATRPPSVQFSLFYVSAPFFADEVYSRRSVPFSEAGMLAFAASSPAWGFRATDSTGIATGFFPTIADPEAMPFADNVRASDGSRTPIISWELPDLTGFDVDRVRLRAIDALGGQVFQVSLAPTATSFAIPEGALLSGHSYFYRVMIEDLNDGRIENRSNAFSRAAIAVAEPGSLGLLGIALIAATGMLRRPRAR